MGLPTTAGGSAGGGAFAGVLSWFSTTLSFAVLMGSLRFCGVMP
jgi:hypothetical protein